MQGRDMEQLGEVLDTVSEKIPKLIRETLNSLYSPDTGAKMGKAVGSFYKELIEAGIPHEDALKMARDYMLSIKDAMNFKDK